MYKLISQVLLLGILSCIVACDSKPKSEPVVTKPSDNPKTFYGQAVHSATKLQKPSEQERDTAAQAEQLMDE